MGPLESSLTWGPKPIWYTNTEPESCFLLRIRKASVIANSQWLRIDTPWVPTSRRGRDHRRVRDEALFFRDWELVPTSHVASLSAFWITMDKLNGTLCFSLISRFQRMTCGLTFRLKPGRLRGNIGCVIKVSKRNASFVWSCDYGLKADVINMHDLRAGIFPGGYQSMTVSLSLSACMQAESTYLHEDEIAGIKRSVRLDSWWWGSQLLGHSEISWLWFQRQYRTHIWVRLLSDMASPEIVRRYFVYTASILASQHQRERTNIKWREFRQWRYSTFGRWYMVDVQSMKAPFKFTKREDFWLLRWASTPNMTLCSRLGSTTGKGPNWWLFVLPMG